MVKALCRDCNDPLEDHNWTPSFRKNGNHTCKYCYNKRHNSKNNKDTNRLALYINGKYISRKDPRYKVFKPGYYKNINDAIFEQSSISTIKEGYVYVITNKAWPDWVKIGMAIDAEDRLSGYQTSSPHRDYVLNYSVSSNDRRKSEQEAHNKAAILALEQQGEWFKLPVEQAINILDNLDEHRLGTTEEADTSKDELQERPIQGDLWSYAENKQAG